MKQVFNPLNGFQHSFAAFEKYGLKMGLALMALALLQGCAYISSASVYEGIRGADKTKTTGTTQTPASLPNYDRYEKERDALKK